MFKKTGGRIVKSDLCKELINAVKGPQIVCPGHWEKFKVGFFLESKDVSMDDFSNNLGKTRKC